MLVLTHHVGTSITWPFGHFMPVFPTTSFGTFNRAVDLTLLYYFIV